jgi:hypothetical protein
MGFTRLFEDSCVYVRKSGNAFAIIYVDDAIIAAPSKEDVDIFVQRITGVETSDQLLGAYIFCVSSVRPTLVSLERLLPSLRTGRGPAFSFHLQAATPIKSASRDMDNRGELSQ